MSINNITDFMKQTHSSTSLPTGLCTNESTKLQDRLLNTVALLHKQQYVQNHTRMYLPPTRINKKVSLEHR